ncbi:hypothetical protein EW146_g5308 [Bondarzewia mesenterica]|uniref:Uncharacterized protein n=1 Tax=Bondarzewia mesenterica TaxID=1095465 RepID=A0A4S4LRZ6_9AGAM|nr:hypothetical protein EW146_g5308 [Bondarzewia mesenterica]
MASTQTDWESENIMQKWGAYTAKAFGQANADADADQADTGNKKGKKPLLELAFTDDSLEETDIIGDDHNVHVNAKSTVPWSDLKEHRDDYMDEQYLSDGYLMKEPSKMMRTDVVQLINHWKARQAEDEELVVFKGYRTNDGGITLIHKEPKKKTAMGKEKATDLELDEEPELDIYTDADADDIIKQLKALEGSDNDDDQDNQLEHPLMIEPNVALADIATDHDISKYSFLLNLSSHSEFHNMLITIYGRESYTSAFFPEAVHNTEDNQKEFFLWLFELAYLNEKGKVVSKDHLWWIVLAIGFLLNDIYQRQFSWPDPDGPDTRCADTMATSLCKEITIKIEGQIVESDEDVNVDADADDLTHIPHGKKAKVIVSPIAEGDADADTDTRLPAHIPKRKKAKVTVSSIPEESADADSDADIEAEFNTSNAAIYHSVRN